MAEFCGDIIESYVEDERVFKTRLITYCVTILACCVGLLGLVANPYMLHLLVSIGIAIIGAIGLNFITGMTGMISLGHGAFIGVGAYATAILTDRLGLSFVVALPLAAMITAGVGMFFGLPSMRIKGLYLLMATLAAQVIINFLMTHCESLTMGINGYPVKPVALGSFVFDTERRYFYLTYALTILCIIAAKNIARSRYGRAFVAIRDRDIAADVIGVNLFKYKTLAFAIGSFYAGVAGGLLAPYLTLITPEAFPLDLSIGYLAMIIVGGLGSIMGAIYGAIFMTLLPEFLRITMEEYLVQLVPDAIRIVPYCKSIMFGLIIIGFLVFDPHGLAEIHRRIKKYFKLWPFPY
jgi:branched-chain amino acid transport system permease protein